jgi:hypothetical protein
VDTYITATRLWDTPANAIKKLEHPNAQKNEFLWLPALHTFGGCPHQKPHAKQPPKECNFCQRFIKSSFRLTYNIL